MLFNKNNVRKVNDRKVLHKVGKNWKVVSLALLMAIGGGAVATHANANASSNNNANNDEYLDIQGSKYINKGYNAPSSAASSNANKPAKSADYNNISYVSGYGGSAASYHAKTQSGEADYQSNQNIVNSYVTSLNAKFPNQTNSLNSAYNSASAKTNGDQASAQSYSAIATQSNYSSQVSSLASKAGLTYSGYVQSVSFSASSFANAVSTGASTVSQMNVVNSYAQLISNINNNGALKSEYAAKYYAGNDALTVDKAYASNAQTLYNGLVNNSSANDTNLTSATEKSAANSAAEEIAHINSGLDANTTNSLASALGYSNTSSATSSETSALAKNFASNFSGSVNYTAIHGNPVAVPVSANNNNGQTSASINANNVYVLLSDTATMQAYGSTAASANSVIASATAAKPSYSNVIASASAALQSYNNEVDSVTSSVAIDSILANNPTLSALFDTYKTNNNVPKNNGSHHVDLNTVANQLVESNGSFNVNNAQSVLGNFVNATEAKALAQGLNTYDYFEPLTSSNNVIDAMNNVKSVIVDAINNGSNNIGGAIGAYTPDNANNADKAKAGAAATAIIYDGAQENKRVFNDNNAALANAKDLNDAISSLEAGKDVANPTPANDNAGGNVNLGTGLLNPNSYLAASAVVSGFDNASAINSLTTSVANSYGNEQSASASYAKATDQDVTLANIYAASYSNDVNSDASVESATKNSLDDFYAGHADAKYANASSAASSDASAVPNYKALAYANGMHVYNYGPKIITVIKNAAIHTNANYGKFGDKRIASVPAGTKLNVLGDGFTLNGGVVYHVNFKGHNGFITNLSDFVKQTYLNPGNVSVTVNKDSSVHTDPNAWNKNTNVGVIKAGQNIEGQVYSVDGIRGGFTRMAFQYKGNTYYTSSNTDYVSLNGNVDINSNGTADENGSNVPSNSHVIFGA